MKLIILDFDGTIGDTKELIVRTFQQTIEELKMESRSNDECAATIGLPLKEAFKNLYNIDDETSNSCAESYRRIFYRNNVPGAVKPFPHTIETLHHLHSQGYTLSIASSRSHRSLDEYVNEMQLNNIINYVLGADDTLQAKPHPAPVLKTLEHFSCTPQDAIVVGDTHFDILMGRNALCHTCGVTYGNGTRNELMAAGAQYIIDDFRELIDIL